MQPDPAEVGQPKLCPGADEKSRMNQIAYVGCWTFDHWLDYDFQMFMFFFLLGWVGLVFGWISRCPFFGMV